jgi:hypothetical protein
MNIIRKIVTAGVAALALGGMAATTAATAAPASTAAPTAAAKHLPVLYGSMGGRWHSNGVRPYAIGLGADWVINKMSWFRWNGSSAYGSGKEVTGGYGNNGKPFTDRWWVRITLTDVKYHHGRPYYDHMKMVGHAPRGVPVTSPGVQELRVRNGVRYYVQYN